jgi:hypothetical protein
MRVRDRDNSGGRRAMGRNEAMHAWGMRQMRQAQRDRGSEGRGRQKHGTQDTRKKSMARAIAQCAAESSAQSEFVLCTDTRTSFIVSNTLARA